MVSSVCPQVDDLKAFVVGDLPEVELERIASHVTDCENCHVSLQELDGYADLLVTELQVLGSEPADKEHFAVPQGLVEVARSVGRRQIGGMGTEVSLDSGLRLARKLSEGPCLVGRFELEAELGVGSFGYVFRARDAELDRTVALKVQRAGSFADAEEIERFFREARSAAQLKHPGIVAIHDTGRTDEDICYLVTEYIDGETLESRLQAGRIGNGQAAELIAEIADALQYAHEHGVIHRDIKPSNILLDKEFRPHIADFGLAKRETGDTMTSDGRVMGTPAYMSPEQARGETHQVDVHSDIYSLGVILYEMLTGERPFQGNRRMLLLQVLEDEPRPVRQLDDKIPRDLETICLKAMAKSPARRYQSAGELAEDLRRYQNGEPIRARPVGSLEKLWRWCLRYPPAAVLLLAVSLGSIAGFSYLSGLSTYFVQSTAIDSARFEAYMLEDMHAVYSDVLSGFDSKALHVKIMVDYQNKFNALPLPATFTKRVSRQISLNESGMKVRLFSQYPMRPSGAPENEFEHTALREIAVRLQDKTTKAPEKLEYYEFVTLNERPFLNYSRGWLMKQSCVECHNDNKETGKTDWKEGDLAGVLAISRPLDRDIERTREGLQGAFVLMGSVGILLVAMSFVVVLAGRYRNRAKIPV